MKSQFAYLRKIFLHPSRRPEIEFVGRKMVHKSFVLKGSKHEISVYLSNRPTSGFYYVSNFYQNNACNMSTEPDVEVVFFKSIFEVMKRLEMNYQALAHAAKIFNEGGK